MIKNCVRASDGRVTKDSLDDERFDSTVRFVFAVNWQSEASPMQYVPGLFSRFHFVSEKFWPGMY